MAADNEMEKYKGLCARYKWTDKFIRISVIAISILSLFSGIAVIINSAIKNDFSHLYLFIILSLVLPIALWVGYLIWLVAFDIKRRDKFMARIYESGLSADEVMQIGNEVGMDLFSVALNIRCIKELKMTSIPEWCARDEVLPEKP